MELQFLEDAPGFFRWKDLIQRCRFVCRQIIQHHSDNLRPWIQIIHQPLHAVRKILHGMLQGDADMVFGLQRFEYYITQVATQQDS